MVLSKAKHFAVPDLEIIIIDIQLGKESGFELVSRIKLKFPQIKVVIYSMFDTLGFKLQAKDLFARTLRDKTIFIPQARI